MDDNHDIEGRRWGNRTEKGNVILVVVVVTANRPLLWRLARFMAAVQDCGWDRVDFDTISSVSFQFGSILRGIVVFSWIGEWLRNVWGVVIVVVVVVVMIIRLSRMDVVGRLLVNGE